MINRNDCRLHAKADFLNRHPLNTFSTAYQNLVSQVSDFDFSPSDWQRWQSYFAPWFYPICNCHWSDCSVA
jgi:hypothetical protein